MKATGLHDSGNPREECGFTRNDLLAIIGVLILSGLIFVSSQAATGRKAGMMECKNNLRQVGVAIDQYTRDHTDTLPGPLWSAAFYTYQSNTNGKLAAYLATYLGLPDPDSTPRVAPPLQCPASMDIPKGLFDSSSLVVPVYFFSPARITNAPGNTFNYPFGRPGFPETAPAKIGQIRRPSEQWALQDIDRRNSPSASATYYQFLPLDPVHTARPGGTRQTFYRNLLHFDWSVRSQLMSQ